MLLPVGTVSGPCPKEIAPNLVNNRPFTIEEPPATAAPLENKVPEIFVLAPKPIAPSTIQKTFSEVAPFVKITSTPAAVLNAPALALIINSWFVLLLPSSARVLAIDAAPVKSYTPGRSVSPIPKVGAWLPVAGIAIISV